jgi:alpha- and gamma-adaptin-binding protein p34
VKAVGAWVYCFTVPGSNQEEQEVGEILKAVQDISEVHAGYGSETVMLAVAIPSEKTKSPLSDEQRDRLDDLSVQYGFELVDFVAEGKNGFGEKLGLDRLREALEANEWTDAADVDDDELDTEIERFEDDDDDLESFARDEAEMTAELFGMKAALVGSDFEPDADDIWTPRSQATQVADLDRMMSKLLTVKEQSADLPEQQRKRLAAQAVRELLNDNAAT